MNLVVDAIEFDHVDDFLDRLRASRSQMTDEVRARIEVWKIDDRKYSQLEKRLLGDLLEFQVVAEAIVGDHRLRLTQQCGEFRSSLHKEPPLSAEAAAVMGKIEKSLFRHANQDYIALRITDVRAVRLARKVTAS